MFQSRRQTTFGNINLGNLSAPPSQQDMQFLLEQATKYRSRFVEVSWVVASNGSTFQLTTKVLPTQPDPAWMLYRDSGGGSQLVWGHSSSDLTLMHNLVILESERGLNSAGISADAMEGMIANSNLTGSMAGFSGALSVGAGGAVEGSARLRALAQEAPGNASQQFKGSDPASVWLRNLRQAPDAYRLAPEPPLAQERLDSTELIASNAPVTIAAVHCYSAIEVGERLLDGSLANICVPNVLRYLHDNGCTGRLALQCADNSGEIFVRAGELKHAATLDTKGEDALYDMATWATGFFHFSTEDQTTQISLAFESPVLIENCQKMLECMEFLIEQGLNPASYLERAAEVQRPEFEAHLTRAKLSADMNKLWRFFESASGNATFSQILRANPLTRIEWVPILFNLVRLQMLKITDKPQARQPGDFIEPAQIDQATIDKFMSAATYPADGLLSRGLFLWLLQQEYYRFERMRSRFALVIFNVSLVNRLDGSMSALSRDAFSEACKRILASKRKLDIAGHFDDEYALLLPETDSAGAAVFANRILQLWGEPVLDKQLNDSCFELIGSFGIASVPDDVKNLGTLISAARIARKKSAMMGASVVLYSQ